MVICSPEDITAVSNLISVIVFKHEPSNNYADSTRAKFYHVCMYLHVYMQQDAYTCTYTYSKISLNRPTTGPTINGPFREVVGLGN